MIVANWKEFMRHGIGAMLWSRDAETGLRTLLVRVPDGQGGASNIRIFPQRTPKDWAKAGEIMGWDGNVDEPTLRPSVDVPGAWHGFIVRGALCADQEGLQVQWP